ncbi:MAG TPA: arginase family protein [Longimicrobium sp.]|nr:arginase family protein [Longimicrobium sp.]
MAIDLIQVPYDSARRGERMGRGPLWLAENGALDRLRAVDGDVRETTVEARLDFRAEVGTAFELARSIALAVRSARGRGSFPLVLAGNCMASLGVLAGLGTADTGVIWFDAHGDLNTPETTTSGFLDGMALATVVGRCWTRMAASVADFTPVAEDRVALVGTRDLDDGELRLLEHSRVLLVTGDEVHTRGEDGAMARLEALAGRVSRVYLHLDLDVHDPSEGRANQFAVEGGLTAEGVRRAVRTIAAHVPIAGASVTAYDPDHDADGRMLANALELLAVLGEVGERAARLD